MKALKILRQASFVVLSVLIGLLISEAVVRSFAAIGGEVGHRLALRDPMGVVYGPYGNFGYRQRPGMTEKFRNGTSTTANSIGYRGPEEQGEKPKGTYRVGQ